MTRSRAVLRALVCPFLVLALCACGGGEVAATASGCAPADAEAAGSAAPEATPTATLEAAGAFVDPRPADPDAAPAPGDPHALPRPVAARDARELTTLTPRLAEVVQRLHAAEQAVRLGTSPAAVVPHAAAHGHTPAPPTGTTPAPSAEPACAGGAEDAPAGGGY